MENEFSIVGLLDKYLRELNDNKRDRLGRLSASESGRCDLMRYWKYHGIEGRPLADRSLRIFKAGDLFHDFMQNMTKATKITKLSEELMSYKHKGEEIVFGSPDDVVMTPDGEYVLYDYKSVHSGKFHYLKSKRDTHYEKQVVMYEILLEQNHPEIKLASKRILYISKDDLCLKEVAVFSDTETKKQLIADTVNLYEMCKSKQQPEAIPKEEWECSATYCDYYLQCERGRAIEAQKLGKKTMRL